MSNNSYFSEFELICKNCDYSRAKKVYNDLCKSNFVDGRKGVSKDPVGIYLFYNIYNGEKLVGVSEDSRLIKYEDILSRELYGLLNRYSNWLENFIEDSTLQKSKVILRDHFKRANKLLGLNCEIEVIHDIISELVELLRVKSEVVSLSKFSDMDHNEANQKKGPKKAGRNRSVSSERLYSKYTDLLSKARNATEHDRTFHCIHRVGNLEGQPNISYIATILLDNDEEIRNKYTSKRGLEKAINRSVRDEQI